MKRIGEMQFIGNATKIWLNETDSSANASYATHFCTNSFPYGWHCVLNLSLIHFWLISLFLFLIFSPFRAQIFSMQNGLSFLWTLCGWQNGMQKKALNEYYLCSFFGITHIRTHKITFNSNRRWMCVGEGEKWRQLTIAERYKLMENGCLRISFVSSMRMQFIKAEEYHCDREPYLSLRNTHAHALHILDVRMCIGAK